jgi:hypothetical protein
MLDQAAHAGLPVPPGAILPAELMRVFLDNDLIVANGERVLIPDPELLHNTLFHSVRLPRFERPVTVKPILSNKGKQPQTPDGLLAVSPDVNLNDASQAAAALAAAWSAILNYPDARGDVLILECVDSEFAGQARTLQAGDEQIEVEDHGKKSVLNLPRLRGRQASTDLPPYARRLQMLLGGVRRTFGRGDYTVEWADDGMICWLLQVYSHAPVTRLESDLA